MAGRVEWARNAAWGSVQPLSRRCRRVRPREAEMSAYVCFPPKAAVRSRPRSDISREQPSTSVALRLRPFHDEDSAGRCPVPDHSGGKCLWRTFESFGCCEVRKLNDDYATRWRCSLDRHRSTSSSDVDTAVVLHDWRDGRQVFLVAGRVCDANVSNDISLWRDTFDRRCGDRPGS